MSNDLSITELERQLDAYVTQVRQACQEYVEAGKRASFERLAAHTKNTNEEAAKQLKDTLAKYDAMELPEQMEDLRVKMKESAENTYRSVLRFNQQELEAFARQVGITLPK